MFSLQGHPGPRGPPGAPGLPGEDVSEAKLNNYFYFSR